MKELKVGSWVMWTHHDPSGESWEKRGKVIRIIRITEKGAIVETTIGEKEIIPIEKFPELHIISPRVAEILDLEEKGVSVEMD